MVCPVGVRWTKEKPSLRVSFCCSEQTECLASFILQTGVSLSATNPALKKLTGESQKSRDSNRLLP